VTNRLVKHAFFQTRAVAEAFKANCEREGMQAVRVALTRPRWEHRPLREPVRGVIIKGHEVLWADSSEALIYGQI